VTPGTVTASQGHQPPLGRLLPYSWPGLPRSGEPGRERRRATAPRCPGSAAGRAGGAARSAPTYLHPPPARSLRRRRAVGLRQRVGVRDPTHGSTSHHSLGPPKTAGQRWEGFTAGQSRARAPHARRGGPRGVPRDPHRSPRPPPGSTPRGRG